MHDTDRTEQSRAEQNRIKSDLVPSRIHCSSCVEAEQPSLREWGERKSVACANQHIEWLRGRGVELSVPHLIYFHSGESDVHLDGTLWNHTREQVTE